MDVVCDDFVALAVARRQTPTEVMERLSREGRLWLPPTFAARLERNLRRTFSGRLARDLTEGQRLTALTNLTAFERPARAVLAATVAELEAQFDLHVNTWLEALATAQIVRGVIACGAPNAYGQALDRVHPAAATLGIDVVVVDLPWAKRRRPT